MKAPHKVAAGGWKVKHTPHHHPKPPPGKKPPLPARHKKPPKPKPPPKPVKTKAHKKPRKLSPGSDVACCSAQAVGTLLGWDWEQVLELYWRTASDPDAGATIADTLEAADAGGCGGSTFRRLSLVVAPEPQEPRCAVRPAPYRLILGVTLPEPHAIAVTPDGTWWSWGQPFNPAGWPDLVIEEAWCLR